MSLTGEESYNELTSFIHTGGLCDVEGLKKFVDSNPGLDINTARDPDIGDSVSQSIMCLIRTAKKERTEQDKSAFECLKYLVSKGMKVEYKALKNSFSMAFNPERVEQVSGIIKEMMDCGVTPNYSDKNILYDAVVPEIAKVLIDAKADVNAVDARDKEKCGLLGFYAAKPDMIKVLVDAGLQPKGPDLALVSYDGQSLRHVLQNLSGNLNLNASSYSSKSEKYNGWTALQAALSNFSRYKIYCGGLEGANELISMLLAAKCDPNVVGEKNKEPPLAIALNSAHLYPPRAPNVAFQLLLDAKADANVELEGGVPILHRAAEKSGFHVKILLEHKADLHAKDSKGIPALAYATNNTYRQPVEILISAGMDPNLIYERDGKKMTACEESGYAASCVKGLGGFSVEGLKEKQKQAEAKIAKYCKFAEVSTEAFEKEVRDLFEKFDDDKNGFLDRTEFVKLCKSVTKSTSRKEASIESCANLIFEQFDLPRWDKLRHREARLAIAGYLHMDLSHHRRLQHMLKNPGSYSPQFEKKNEALEAKLARAYAVLEKTRAKSSSVDKIRKQYQADFKKLKGVDPDPTENVSQGMKEWMKTPYQERKSMDAFLIDLRLDCVKLWKENCPKQLEKLLEIMEVPQNARGEYLKRLASLDTHEKVQSAKEEIKNMMPGYKNDPKDAALAKKLAKACQDYQLNYRSAFEYEMMPDVFDEICKGKEDGEN